MRVLVLGGTGWVGRAVVQRLAADGADVRFTWHSNEALAAALPGVGYRVDLAEPNAVEALFTDLDDDGWVPDALVHAARPGVRAPWEPELDRALRVHVHTTLAATRAMAARPADGVRNVVIFGALDRAQSFPMAPHLAAVQGALPAMAMALGHELGPKGLRVNVVALGVLDGGAAESVPADQIEAYKRFSALRRIGTAEEAATTAAWLVRGNRALNGKVLASNGGI